MRDRRSAARDDRHLLAVARVSADGAVDCALRVPQVADRDRLVLAVDAVLLQAVREDGVRKIVLCHDEQPARVLVDAVHNARAALTADA